MAHTQQPLDASALAGRHAVVSGAAGGIGSAIVAALTRAGAQVHALDRDAAGLARLAGSGVIVHAVDLAERADTDRALHGLTRALNGRCDVLINNAGVSAVRSFADSDDALLDRLLAVNFSAAFRLTRALLPLLHASPQAAVVNIASELALVGQRGYSAYCATKGALLAWSRALAVELADSSIRVNTVCPGPIDTPMLAAEFATSRDAAASRAAEIASVPMARLGTPADIAAVVTFLASPAAAFVTGAAWSVDGGKTAL